MNIIEIMFVIVMLLSIGSVIATNIYISYKMGKNRTNLVITQLLKGITIIILFLLILLSLLIGRWLFKHPIIVDPNYDRATYTVVFHNNTKKEIKNINIYIGKNRVYYDTIETIRANQYRKLNIKTRESEFINSIVPPYDVYVQCNEINNNYCVGYFGIETGGFELVNLTEHSNGDLSFQQENHETINYTLCDRRDKKNQRETEW